MLTSLRVWRWMVFAGAAGLASSACVLNPAKDDAGFTDVDAGVTPDAGTDAGAAPESDAGGDAGSDAGGMEGDAGTDGGTTSDAGAPSVSWSTLSQSAPESTGTVVVPIVLSAASSQTVSVPYTVSGTATAVADHNAVAGTVVFSPGTIDASVMFNVVNDAIDEPDETVVLTLGAPTNADAGGVTTHTVTIIDDDPAPTVSWTTASQDAGEASGTVTVGATLSAPSGFTVTAPYTVSGTATAGADYDVGSGALVFGPGATDASITFPLVNDALNEPSETVVFTFGNLLNANAGANPVHTVQIVDDDPAPTVSWATASQDAGETAGTVSLTATLSTPSGQTVTVPYTVSGTATNPADHNADAGTLTFTPGATAANLSFQIVDDLENEANETIVFTLGSPTNADAGAITAHTVVIADNDGTVKQIVTGDFHACALLSSGKVRCWGFGGARLGYKNTNNIGDNELPATAGDVNIGGDVIQLAASADHTCALLVNGRVRCWGLGTSGELGYGNSNDVGYNNVPADVGDVPIGGDVIQLAAGWNHTCALLSTGKIRCWGDGSFGRLGYSSESSVGNGVGPSIVAAGDVNVGGDAIQITAGAMFTCALLVNGKVRCWGDNPFLGYNRDTPVGDNESPASAGDVPVGEEVIQLAAGAFHACAVLSAGRIRCWGYGTNGRLGYGNTTFIGGLSTDPSISTAGDVNVGGAVVQIAAGFSHTCALLSSGKVRCWGYNPSGQLGYGNVTTVGDNVARTIIGAGDVNVGEDVVQIAAGFDLTCALLGSGRVKCWGSNNYGQLGYGDTQNRGDNEVPASMGTVVVGGTVGVTQVTAGGTSTCARLSNGKVRCWGENNAGQLGYGHLSNIGDNEVPASAGDIYVGDAGVRDIVLGNSHVCARLSNGRVRCWGYGAKGQLGYGNVANIGDNETPSDAGDVTVGGDVVQIAAGDFATCALLATGAVRCWGDGTYGQLGYANMNNIGDNEVPADAGDVSIGNFGAVTQLRMGGYHTCIRHAPGNARCWGSNGYGQLGFGFTATIGDTEYPSTVGIIDVDAGVVDVVAGEIHTCVRISSGAMKCWGANSYGQLGYGHIQSIGDDAGEVPSSIANIQVDDAGIAQIAAGQRTTCARLANGRLKCWGMNLYGQLGYAHTQNIGDDAGEVPATTDYINVGDAGVIQVSAGGNHTCALLSNGKVRCWGRSNVGQLGYANMNNIGDDEFPWYTGDVTVY